MKKIFEELKENMPIKTIASIIIAVLLFLIVMAHVCSCSGLALIKKTTETIPQDSFVEEAIEDVIMNATGVKIDFSGSTPED